MISKKFYDIPMVSLFSAVPFPIQLMVISFTSFSSEFVIAFPSPFKDYFSLSPFLNIFSFPIHHPTKPSFLIAYIAISKTFILILLVPAKKDLFTWFEEFSIE